MRINIRPFQDSLVRVFRKNGLSAEDAVLAADGILEAELAGITTHGVEMIPAHIKKCRSGYNTSASLHTVREAAAFTVVDADNAFGVVSAQKCIRMAIEKCRTSGIHVVFCNNANTFSAAYTYAKYAAEHGMISIIGANAPAQMAPIGGIDKLFGTNPLAIGVPADKEEPFILDMATSAVAKSRINQALHRGDKTIPYGWATDINGVPTNDPKEAVKGLILPMAGPKGYGLAMAIDIIGGVLSGAASMDSVGRFYSDDNACMNVGQFFAVLDPSMIYGGDFMSEMDVYLHKVRTSRSADEKTVLVPGDINLIARRDITENGLELPEHVFESIKRLFEENDERLEFV